MSKNTAQDSPSKGIEWLARFGYAAKGVVYVVIGALTLMSVLHVGGGHTTSSKGAVSTIGSEPFGGVLLIVMAAGLIGYVIWRFTQALKDPEHRGRSVGGILKRLGLLGSGLIYASLALYTIRLVIGGGGNSGGQSKDSITARIMSHEGGVWVIAAIGVLIVIVAVLQFVRAYKRRFEKSWSVETMGPTQRRWAGRIAQWGLSARGVVFLIMGGFLIVGAWQTDPDKATGLDGALDTLAQQSYGAVLLGIVALGLICYGLYCWVNAVHRRINP